MDLQQFLSEGPAEYLLCLMAIPCLAAVLLVLFLSVSFGRRSKKSKMKLGVQETKVETPVKVAVNTPSQPDNVGDTVQDFTTPSLQERLNFGVLSNQAKAQDNRDGGVAMAQEDNILVNTPESDTETIELLRLLRHQSSGRFMVEVAGRQYSRLSDITDKKIGQYVLTLAAHLLAFTGGVVITPAGMKSFTTPKVGDVPLPLAPVRQQQSIPAEVKVPSEPWPVPKPSPEAEAAFKASLQNFKPVQSGSQPPKKQGGFGMSSSGTSATVPSLNLAEEINDIVQARLRYAPLATPSQVEIRNDVGGGILILVNGSAYHGPNEIPDPEIQKLIKDSIKEWERS